MRLNTQTDYALRTLIYLGIRTPKAATIQEISAAYDISQNHLMRVAAKLAKLGYVDAVRGRGGGLRLSKPAGEITVGEIVRQFEPDMQLVSCLADHPDRCRIEPSCRLKGVLQNALEAFLAQLNHATLADICQPRSDLHRLLVLSG